MAITSISARNNTIKAIILFLFCGFLLIASSAHHTNLPSHIHAPRQVKPIAIPALKAAIPDIFVAPRIESATTKP
jgi:hypothetical protein